MGILSAMGVAGLQGAVENNRVKDAALNTTAFLERVAVAANKRSETLCLKKASDQKIEVYVGSDCKKASVKVDEFTIESPLKFVDQCPSFGCDGDEGCSSNWLASSGSVGVFEPKLGLSAAPVGGFVCAQYGSESHYAAALKSKNKNTITAMICDDGCDEL